MLLETFSRAKRKCFVYYEREGRRNSAFLEVDDIYISGSLFKNLESHLKDLIANRYTDRCGSILIVDFKLIA